MCSRSVLGLRRDGMRRSRRRRVVRSWLPRVTATASGGSRTGSVVAAHGDQRDDQRDDRDRAKHRGGRHGTPFVERVWARLAGWCAPARLGRGVESSEPRGVQVVTVAASLASSSAVGRREPADRVLGSQRRLGATSLPARTRTRGSCVEMVQRHSVSLVDGRMGPRRLLDGRLCRSRSCYGSQPLPTGASNPR